MPAAPRSVLRRLGLASPGDQARRDEVDVRGVLRLRPAPRGRQDPAPPEPGLADPRARPPVPRPRRDPLHDLEPLGREHRQLVARRRCHGAAAHGRGRLRRRAGRLVDAQRADLRGSPRRRELTRQHPRVPTRPVRRRRNAADPWSGPRHRLRPADGRRLRLPEHAAELARGLGFLAGRGDLRQRLVAGGVRRLPQLRDPGRCAVGPPRLPERLPPAQARARGRRARDDRARARIPARRVQPARERRLAARERAGAGRWSPWSR